MIPGSEQHGLHFSVHDKTGDVILLQLNEGGKMIIHQDEEDLRVMANEPLQQYHREYVAKFDMGDINTAAKIPSTISSLDRNLRLLWTTGNQKNWEGLSWAQTEGKLQSTFDAGALVPQDVIDPNYGGTYTTWIQFVYNLENGEIKTRNLETYSDIRFNMKDIASFDKPMCADLALQASEGITTPVWTECNVEMAKNN